MKILISEKQLGKLRNYLIESEDPINILLNDCVLSFSTENTKLGNKVVTFSLPAGWSCPFAKGCLKKVERKRIIDPSKVGTFKTSEKTGGKIPYKGDIVSKTGPETEFFCYSASQEAMYDDLREKRWRNLDLLKMAAEKGGSSAQADLIVNSLNYFFDSEGEKDEVRIHESGDFYNKEYLLAWIEVAQRMPDVNFYCYTKSIPYIKEFKELIDETPNFAITLSTSGRRDEDIAGLDIKTSKIFNTPEEVLAAGLIVDLDDTLAKGKGGHEKDFALLLHGTQKTGESARNKLRNETFMNYWKYLKMLNRNLGYTENYRMTTEEAKNQMKKIKDLISGNRKFAAVDKKRIEMLRKNLNYIIKYNNYGFSDDLINILPQKYRVK